MDERDALHHLVDRAPKESLAELLALLFPIVYPPDPSDVSQIVTFFPTEPGTTMLESSREAEFETRQRLTPEADVKSVASRMQEALDRALDRLRVRPETLGRPVGESALTTADGFLELRCDWQSETGRHRLGTFYLEQQEIATFERVQMSETGAEL